MQTLTCHNPTTNTSSAAFAHPKAHAALETCRIRHRPLENRIHIKSCQVQHMSLSQCQAARKYVTCSIISARTAFKFSDAEVHACQALRPGEIKNCVKLAGFSPLTALLIFRLKGPTATVHIYSNVHRHGHYRQKRSHVQTQPVLML